MLCTYFSPRLVVSDSTGHVQVGLGRVDEGGEIALVLALDILESEDCGGLLVDNSAEAGLALDNDVWDAHLAAKRRKEHDELDRVNIMSDDDQRGFLGLDESHAVVETRLDEKRLLVLGGFFLFGGSFCNGLETGLLLLLGLRTVPVSRLKRRIESRRWIAHLLRSLKSCAAVFLSRVLENWAMAGGTFRRCLRMTFWRWSRTYSGHFTKRVRSVLGRMSCPVEALRICCVEYLAQTYRYQNYEVGTQTEGFWLIWSPPWNLVRGQAFCRILAWTWGAKANKVSIHPNNPLSIQRSLANLSTTNRPEAQKWTFRVDLP